MLASKTDVKLVWCDYHSTEVVGKANPEAGRMWLPLLTRAEPDSIVAGINMSGG
jgi:hypothetical protein